jgi:hypothetical protein
VVLAQQACEGVQSLVADDLGPALRPGLTVDVAEDLTTLVVEAERPGRVRKTHRLQLPEQGVHRRGPRLGGAADGVADAYDLSVLVILHRPLDRIGVRHRVSVTVRVRHGGAREMPDGGIPLCQSA